MSLPLGGDIDVSPLGPEESRVSLSAALTAFCKAEAAWLRSRKLRAITFSSAASAGVAAYFAIVQRPDGAARVLVVALAILAISLVAVPFTILLESHRRTLRHAMARRFYTMGLRVDDAGRLLTNDSEGEVVFDPAKPQAGGPSCRN